MLAMECHASEEQPKAASLRQPDGGAVFAASHDARHQLPFWWRLLLSPQKTLFKTLLDSVRAQLVWEAHLVIVAEMAFTWSKASAWRTCCS